MTFTPSPLPPNPNDPIPADQNAPPPKRNVQVVHPLIRTVFPDEDFNQTIPICIIKRSPHPSDRAVSVYSSGSTLSQGPPRRSSSLPRISEKERIALALEKQKKMEAEYQALVTTQTPTPQSTKDSSPRPGSAGNSRQLSQPKPRPGSLMLEEVFRGRKQQTQNSESKDRRSSPAAQKSSPVESGRSRSENNASTRPVIRGHPAARTNAVRAYTPSAGSYSPSRGAQHVDSSTDDESSDENRSEQSSRKGLSDIEAEMARNAQEEQLKFVRKGKSPKIAQKDLAADAAWRDLIRYLRSFIAEFDKTVRAGTTSGNASDGANPARKADDCGDEFQLFLQHLYEQLQSMNRLPSEMSLDDTMEWIESYLTQHLFPMYVLLIALI